MTTQRSINSVGMVLKRDHPEAVVIARQLAGWLGDVGKSVIAEDELAEKIGAEAVSTDELVRRADLIVVAGGDGTLLSIARKIGPRETPILGINLGGLGFLTEVTAGEARAALARVIEGDYEIERRITLEAWLERHGRLPLDGDVHRFYALNDVVINNGPLGRMLRLEVTADGKPFCIYRADGLIVSTPTGSTAYALSAGGPIVYPTLEAIVLAPICPFTLSNRPVVLPGRFEVEVTITSSDSGAIITVDGQDSQELGENDKVIIRRGSHMVALVRSVHEYFEIWRDKLRWG